MTTVTCDDFALRVAPVGAAVTAVEDGAVKVNGFMRRVLLAIFFVRAPSRGTGLSGYCTETGTTV